MYDAKTGLVTELTKVGIPVYYELFVDSNTTTPCITYIENNNYDYSIGSTFGYSKISFIVKLWGNDISTLTTHATSVDRYLRAAGYTRTSANELTYDTQIQKVFTYEALAKENY